MRKRTCGSEMGTTGCSPHVRLSDFCCSRRSNSSHTTRCFCGTARQRASSRATDAYVRLGRLGVLGALDEADELHQEREVLRRVRERHEHKVARHRLELVVALAKLRPVREQVHEVRDGVLGQVVHVRGRAALQQLAAHLDRAVQRGADLTQGDLKSAGVRALEASGRVYLRLQILVWVVRVERKDGQVPRRERDFARKLRQLGCERVAHVKRRVLAHGHERR